jgi:Fur family transcriptional regulator, ferric uptake regulator
MIRNRNNEDSQPVYISTPQRQLILETIRKFEKPVNARDLYQVVSKKDNTVSLATVYRTIALFKNLGIIDEHRLGKTCWCYELKKSFEHQHVICKQCGKVIEFESPLITQMVKYLQTEKRFATERVEVCIQGICIDCQRKVD